VLARGRFSLWIDGLAQLSSMSLQPCVSQSAQAFPRLFEIRLLRAVFVVADR